MKKTKHMRLTALLLAMLMVTSLIPLGSVTAFAQDVTVISQDFESGMNGWTLIDAHTNTDISSNESNVHEGEAGFFFNYSLNPPQYLISPLLSIPASSESVTFSMHYKRSSNAYPEMFSVGYSTTDSSKDSFSFFDQVIIESSNTTWNNYTVDTLPVDTKYVCIRYDSNDMVGMSIDAITVTAKVSSGEGSSALHSHSFTYTSSGDSITAVCADGCPDGYDKNGITISLAAPADTEYDGKAKAASVTGAYPSPAPAGLAEAPTEITYFKDNTEAENKLSGAPADEGNYFARISWGGETAVVGYSIYGDKYLKVHVRWDDDNNANGYRMTNIVASMPTPGGRRDLLLNESNNWTGIYTGASAAYTQINMPEGGFMYELLPAWANNHTVFTPTYTYRSRLLSEMYTDIIWNDNNDELHLRPDEVSVSLIRDGEPLIENEAISLSGWWYTCWGKLPKYQYGGYEPSVYTVRPDSVPAHYTYEIQDDVNIVYTRTSTHEWTYSAGTNSITASCSADGCQYHTKGVTVALVPPKSGAYTGSAFEAAIDSSALGDTPPDNLAPAPASVEYYKTKGVGSTETDGEALSGAPVNAGNYAVKMTWGGVTVSAPFTIGKAAPNVPDVPTDLTAECGTKAGAITLPDGFMFSSPSDTVTRIGSNPFTLIYMPADNDNYDIVTGIAVNVTGTGIHHEADPATCTENGTVEYWEDGAGRKYSDENGQNELTDITEKALGHDWSEVTYTWAADPENGCLAVRTCTREGCGEFERELCEGDDLDCREIKAADCENDGEEIYTATFDNPDFKEQQTTKTLKKLGHRFINFLKWTWESFKKAVAALFCDNDPDHIMTIDVPTSVETATEPTCEEPGYIYHVATIDVAGRIEKGYKFEEIAPLGHKWEQRGWSWRFYDDDMNKLDLPEACAVFNCLNDEDHEMLVAATVTVSETDTATVYTATAEYDGETYTTTAEFPKETPDTPVDTPDTPDSPDVPDTDSDTDEPTNTDTDTDEPTDTDTDTDEPTDTDTDTDEPTDTDTDTDEPTDTDTDDEPEYAGLLGDVNQDGNVNSEDALMILRCSAELDSFDSVQTLLGDIDGDGTITAGDALEVLRYSVGMAGEDTPISKPITAKKEA